ncbi:unnamed protein product, partial [Didymodactylos carnosus]
TNAALNNDLNANTPYAEQDYCDSLSRPPSSSSSRNTPTSKSNKRKLDEIADTFSDSEISGRENKHKFEHDSPDERSRKTGTPLSGCLTRNNGVNDPTFNFGTNGNIPNGISDNSNLSIQSPSSTNGGNLLQNIPGVPPSQTSLLTQSSLTQQQPPSSYMPISPRNQFVMTNDSPFLQTNSQVFVFTTQLANEAAEAVLKQECPNIIEYHKSLRTTADYLASLPTNLNNHSLLSQLHSPSCHSSRPINMNGVPMMCNGGQQLPPSHWPQQNDLRSLNHSPFGRMTPTIPGGLPQPNVIAGNVLLGGNTPPPPGMRMGHMATHLNDGENLTPEQLKHRTEQLSKIGHMRKTMGVRGRGRGSGRNAPPIDHQQMMMMSGPPGPHPLEHHHHPPMCMGPHGNPMMNMNGPPHHMMHMRDGPPHGMMIDMNGCPSPMMTGPNGPYPFPPGHFHQDPFSPHPHHHQQQQAAQEWSRLQQEHYKEREKAKLDSLQPNSRGQPPPYPSSLTPTSSANTTARLLSPKIEGSTPRLHKVGQPEKFIPENLPSKKLSNNNQTPLEIQMTPSPTQMNYIEMEGEELTITKHVNKSYRSNNGNNFNSSCKDEPMTPLSRSTSTPNPMPQTPLSSQSTTPNHQLHQAPHNHSHLNQNGNNNAQLPPPPPSLTPNSLNNNSIPPPNIRNTSKANMLNSSSPLVHHTLSTPKDEPLEHPKTPTNNMAPPLSSMLQMTNNLQTSNSPYNNGSKLSSTSSSCITVATTATGANNLTSPNLANMAKSVDQLQQQQQSHLSAHHHHPHQMHNMNIAQFQNMNRMGPDHPQHHHLNMYKSPGLMMHDHSPMNGPPPSHGPKCSGKMANHHPSGLYPVNSKLPPEGHMQRLGPPHHQQFMHVQQDDMFSIPPNTPQNQQPQLHPHENRPASINNTYVNATMSIAQLNIQSLGPGLQPGTIHLHHQTSMPHGDPMFAQQFSAMNNEQPNGPFGPQFNDMCQQQDSSAQPPHPSVNSQANEKNMQQTQQNPNSNSINNSSQSPLSGLPPSQQPSVGREKNVQIEPQGVSTIRYKPNSSSSRNRSSNSDIDFLPPPSPQIPPNQNPNRLSKQQQ